MTDTSIPSRDDEPSEHARPDARRTRIAKIADRALFLLIVAVVVSQVVIWNFWESNWGDSLKNLVTYSQYALVVICALAWWCLFAPVPRRVRWSIGAVALALLAGWAASVRDFNFTGHMRINVTYRWEPSAQKQLDERLATQSTLTTEERQALPVPEATAEDMPGYRGTLRTGVLTGPKIQQDWETHPPEELWRQPVGGGYASFAIVEPYAVTLEQRDDDEAVVCYDARSGRELWAYRYPAHFQEAMGGEGPRSTPSIQGDAVYSFGAFGDLCCLDLRLGTLRWHVNALQQFQVPNTTWGMACSPLISQGRVIVNIGGKKGNGLIAYDADDGALLWQTAGIHLPQEPVKEFKTGQQAVPKGGGDSVPGYSSPMIATVGGDELILNLDGMALRGHDLETGTELWNVPFENRPHVNVAQPVVFDDGRIFLSASYDVGCLMVKVTKDAAGWSTERLWSNLNMRCKFTSPILFEGFLYGLDEGRMVCLDPQTGKRKWKGVRSGLRGDYDHGQILLYNDQIIALTEQGQAVLIRPSPEKLEELTWFRVLPEGKNWNPPAIVRGRLYVRNAREMACFDLRAHSSQSPLAAVGE